MTTSKSIRSYYRVIFIILIVLVSLACGRSTTERLSEAAQASKEPPPATEPQSAPATEAQGPAAPKETEPTPTPEPTTPPATPTPQAEAVNLIAQGFGLDGQSLGYAFIVENPNAGFTIEDAQYQIAAYNDANNVVETDSGFIPLLLPQQTLGIGGSMFVDEGVTVSKIEVQLKPGDAEATEPIPNFTVDKITYFSSDFSSSVTGIISSPYNRDITNVRVSSVAYDEAGNIIGGGFSFLNFILANGNTGVETSLTSSGNVARVELYPTLSGLSLLAGEEALPAGVTDLTLVKQGFGQDGIQAGFGLLIENPNGNFAVEGTQYHVTAYADDGRVLGTEEGFVEAILPKQTLGIGGDTFAPEGETISRVEIQLKSGDFKESQVLPTFTVENVSFQEGSFSSPVTGEIVNPYSKDVTNLRVSSLAYNDAGDIIGGGFTFVDFVPANGKAAVEASITIAGTPARVELHPALSGLSEIE